MSVERTPLEIFSQGGMHSAPPTLRFKLLFLSLPNKVHFADKYYVYLRGRASLATLSDCNCPIMNCYWECLHLTNSNSIRYNAKIHAPVQLSV